MNPRELERRMSETLLTSRERSLMGLLFDGELMQEAVDDLTHGLDIDQTNQNFILMLACLGYQRGWGLFPPEIVPRLKGVHRYHQVHNAMGVPWLVEQIGCLTDAGIPVMLLKGAAMRAYYAPDMPRLMWDFDAAVPEERYREALSLLCTGGAKLVEETAHSAALTDGRTQLDLHRWIFKTNEDRGSDIWRRAVSFGFHGIPALVLSPEDMFIHLLDNQSRNYFYDEAPERRMKWLYDCRRVLMAVERPDLDRIADRAGEFHTEARVRMMLKSFIQCFPETFPGEALDRAFPPSREYDELLKNGERFRMEVQKFRRYHYVRDSAMTPLHILRSLRRETAFYRYLAPEMKRSDPGLGPIRFFRKMHQLDDFSALKEKYLARICLWERRPKDGA